MSPLFSIKPEAVAIVDAADKHAILETLSQTFAASYGLDADEVLEHLEELVAPEERLRQGPWPRGGGHEEPGGHGALELVQDREEDAGRGRGAGDVEDEDPDPLARPERLAEIERRDEGGVAPGPHSSCP